jgi:hypothetical protein
MRRYLASHALLALALALPSCAVSPVAEPEAGEAAIGVTGQAVSTSDVARIAVTVTGAGIASPISYSLKKTKGQWSGVIGQIPAGANRSFHADVYDATDAILYAGDATGVTIGNKQTATVVLVLQQKAAPDPFHDTAPFIDSAAASSNAVAPADAVTLAVTAHDVDVGDSISYAWIASGGAFDDASSSHPVWTAPASEGTQTLTVSARDSKGATRRLSLLVDVHATNGRGSASLSASFNAWPVVTNVLATPGRVNVLESTTLTVAASDPDGDALGYHWSDGGCGGSFDSVAAQSPRWTAPATAPGSGACSLVVSVTDGRGGTNTGTIVEQVGPAEQVGLPPVVTATSQSAATVDPGDGAAFYLAATDPAGGSLTFSWSASAGTLGVPTTQAGSSEVVWTAPASGGTFRLTATVSDAAGLTTAQAFDVNVNTCTLGSMRGCYGGPATTEMHAPCQSGRQGCVADAADPAQSHWDVCVGEVLPKPNDACTAGNDDNCNGTPNEGCACLDDERIACGVCGDGVNTCAGGSFGLCLGSTAVADVACGRVGFPS